MAFDHASPMDLSPLPGNLETGRRYAIRTADGFVFLGWATFSHISPARIALRLQSGAFDAEEGSPLFDLILEDGDGTGDRARVLHDHGRYLPCRVLSRDAADGTRALTLLPDPCADAAAALAMTVRFDRGGFVFGTDRLALWVGPS